MRNIVIALCLKLVTLVALPFFLLRSKSGIFLDFERLFVPIKQENINLHSVQLFWACNYIP